MPQFKLYTVNDLNLIQKFNTVDDKVQYLVNANYEQKPYVAVLFQINGYDYVVPLSSSKPKHQTMKNSVDFHKVLNKNGRCIAVLNFNNMLPVRLSHLTLIDINRLINSQLIDEQKYGNLLNDELQFINSKIESRRIQEKAIQLYSRWCNGKLPKNIFERCNNFRKLEQELLNYEKL